MAPSTITSINRLSDKEKYEIYTRVIPKELIKRFNLPTSLRDSRGNPLLSIKTQEGGPTAEMSLFHQCDFPDPVFYGHITDTISGQFHVLLYVLNDPDSPRFDVDRMPDGASTKLGAEQRNLVAELDAMHAGLAPGQIRHGLRLLGEALQAFEDFLMPLGQSIYFAEPLYYHNAILFERYGFAYEKGRRLMERIQGGFSERGDFINLLNGSSPFRMPEAAGSIRLRSWAIHDGLLGEPFTNVTMYKHVGKRANLTSCNGCPW